MLVVDGAMGEGGGQVLRTALALGAATGVPVRVERVRANRPEPGLRPQHRAAVAALAAVCDARVDGIEVGSTVVEFRPGPIVGGDLDLAIGTAGAITLLLQTILPACAASRQSFAFRVAGGTDVPFSPSWDYFAHVHVPLLARLGVEVEATLERRGYFPAGGGSVRVAVGAGGFRRADFVERGPVLRVEGRAHAHALPRSVVGRGAESLRDRLVAAGLPVRDVALEEHRGPGTGFGLGAWAITAESRLGSDALGRRGLRAEDVAAHAARGLVLEVGSGAAVDEHQADQLPVFMALVGGGALVTRHLSAHARTVLDLLPAFLPVVVSTTPVREGVRVEVRPVSR